MPPAGKSFKPATISFELHGFTELARKLKDDDLLADAWRQAMTEVTRHVYDRAIVASPIRSGRTVAMMSFKIQNHPIPLYGVVKTTARRGKYSYPLVLDRRPKWHHVAWFRTAAKSAGNAFGPILDRAAKAIEHKFNR